MESIQSHDAQKPLKATEERLRLYEAAVLGARDAVMITEAEPIDQPGPRVIYVNPAFTEMTGYTLEEVRDKSPRILQGPKTDRAQLDRIRAALKAWQPIRVELTNYRKDGTEFQAELDIAPIANETGRYTHWVSIQRNITDRKQAEKALRESERRLAESEHRHRTLAESLPQLIWTCRADGYCNYLSPQWVAYTGIPAEEHFGTHWLDVIHPEDRPRIKERWQMAVANQAPYAVEYRLRRFDGAYQWFQANGIFLRDRDDHVVQVFGSCTNISEIVQARELLTERREELEKVVEERTSSLQEVVNQLEAFSYTLSHDLRAPLRAIESYAAAILQDHGDLPEDVQEFAKRILSAGRKLDTLTKDILAYSKLPSTGIALSRVDLDKLVPEVIEQYGQVPKVAIDVTSPLGVVHANESLLTQAIANLVTNALKFMLPEKQPRIRIWSETRDQQVRLWIEDNGIGIAPEYQARIWNVFERLHSDLEYAGSGIGLTIVQKAVQRMRGTAGVESDGSNGSKFWIQLIKA